MQGLMYCIVFHINLNVNKGSMTTATNIKALTSCYWVGTNGGVRMLLKSEIKIMHLF